MSERAASFKYKFYCSTSGQLSFGATLLSIFYEPRGQHSLAALVVGEVKVSAHVPQYPVWKKHQFFKNFAC